MTFQAKLTTRSEKYSVGDTVIELSNTVDREQLNQIVQNLLKQLGKLDVDDDNSQGKLSFEFYVGKRLLRLNVEQHLKLYSDEIDVEGILSEKLVEVEYTIPVDSPKPLDTIALDDWVSCVDANESYIISGSYDNSIRIFSIKNRQNIITLPNAHEKPITRVKFLDDCPSIKKPAKKNEIYFVSCGHDEVSILRKFSTKTNTVETICAFRGHNRSVNCVDTFDDLIVTGSFDKTIRIWSGAEESKGDEEIDENDPAADDGSKKRNKKQRTKTSEKSIEKKHRSAIMTLTGHQESVTGVRWLRSCNEYNSIATCSMDRNICIWDIEVGECKRRVLSAKPLLGIDYCNEKNIIISANCDRHIRYWDARAPDNATATTVYTSHNAWVSSVAFGLPSTNNFISGGYDNLVKLWDLRSPKACLYDLIGHHDKVLDVSWSNPNYVLSGSADASLKVFATK